MKFSLIITSIWVAAMMHIIQCTKIISDSTDPLSLVQFMQKYHPMLHQKVIAIFQNPTVKQTVIEYKDSTSTSAFVGSNGDCPTYREVFSSSTMAFKEKVFEFVKNEITFTILIDINHGLMEVYCINSSDAIGSGAQGQVYKAKNIKTNEIVAIKETKFETRFNFGPETQAILEPQIARHRNLEGSVGLMDAARFRKYEKQIRKSRDTDFFLRDVRNEYEMSRKCGLAIGGLIVSSDTKSAYFAMKYVQGVNLFTVLATDEDPAYLAMDTRKLFQDSFSALQQQVHRNGILHNDFTPQNVLVDRQGRVTIIDFGSAIPLTEENKLRDRHTWINVFVKYFTEFPSPVVLHPKRLDEYQEIWEEYQNEIGI